MYNKKIMIDFRHISKMTGFASVLVMILEAIDTIDREFFLLTNNENIIFNKYLKNNKKIKFVHTNITPFSLRQNVEIPLILKKYEIDMFHTINFDIPLFMFLCPKCQLISTIHDLIPHTHKHLHKRSLIKRIYFNFMYKACANLSDKIITVSNYTKNEIVKYLKTDPKKIVVIHNSYLGRKSFSKKNTEFSKPVKLFFLGNNFEHKNILAVIKAVKLLKDKNIEVLFNIAGLETCYTNIMKEYINENNLQNNVKILGKISQEQSETLYKTSDIFVFPSLIEGFGIPLIEAMSYGLPVISSNKTVMPEIVGDAGILIDPTPENFAEKIEFLIKNNDKVKELIQKGYERINVFSQDKFTQKILEVYLN